MDRYVMRHPDTAGVAVVPASAVQLHRGLGWVRVSDAIPEEQTPQVRLGDYADAPDLDAPPAPRSGEENSSPDPDPEPAQTSAGKPARGK